MKYSLEHIEKVGFIHIGGGLITLIAGIISRVVTPGVDTAQAFFNNLIPFALFGFGWYILSQFAAATLYSNLIKGNTFAGKPMSRLDAPPEGEPRSLGLNYQIFEFIVIGLAVVTTVLVTIFLPPDGLALGGFFAGWLVGDGFGRLRFSSKVSDEEAEQKRQFYFSDSLAGPRTEVAYYTDEPEIKEKPKTLRVSETLTETPKKLRPTTPPQPAARPKAQPLVAPGTRPRKKSK